jgi:glycosyltransferase involved in cell wall biosynthesis
VTAVTGPLPGRTSIIPHGIDRRFERPPKIQLPINEYSDADPLQILYVSIVDMYKHQWNVVEAVAQLRKRGYAVSLTLIGPAQPAALKRLRATQDRVDPAGSFIRYVGAVPHSELHRCYEDAHICLFASSCENMPNILLEGMASGLPVACSNRGPMPEVLGTAGIYFDPEDAADVARALKELIDAPAERSKLAQASYQRMQLYSWTRCAHETLGFLAQLASDGK